MGDRGTTEELVGSTRGLLTSSDTTDNMTSSVSPSPRWLGLGEEDQEAWVRELYVVIYGVVVPVVVVLGVVVNSVGLYLLTRPKMRALPVNKYYLFLLGSDVAILLVSISTVVTLNGCRLHSYSEALYFAHPFFTIFYILQTFTLYIILWVCYDRFLALWDFRRFHQARRPPVVRLRMAITGVLCVILHIRHLIEVEVVCLSGVGVVEGVGGAEGCREGAWVLKDSLYRSGRSSEMWRVGMWVVRGLLVLVLPILLVLALSTGIVVGMVRRRINNTAATRRTRGQAYSSIYITLAISITFIISTVPISVHAAFYATNTDHCHGPFSEEVFRGVANLLLLGEHLTHFLILSFNETFRTEMRTLILAIKLSLSSALARMERAGNVFPPHHSPPVSDNRQVPETTVVTQENNAATLSFFVSAPTEQPKSETDLAEVDREAAKCPQVPLATLTAGWGLDGSMAGNGTWEPDRLSVCGSLNPPSRTSVVTVEEEL